MNRNSLGTTVSFVLKRMFRGEDYTSATQSVAKELPCPVDDTTVQSQCSRGISTPGKNKIEADDFKWCVRKIMDQSMQEPFLKMVEDSKPREIRLLFAGLMKQHGLG